MCGIVGLFLKQESLESSLGEWLEPMLVAMADRGPDSAGFAIYHNPAPDGALKLTLYHPETGFNWETIAEGLGTAFVGSVDLQVRVTHAVIVVNATEDEARAWLRRHFPDVRITSVGAEIEIYKEKGLPDDVAQSYAIGQMTGSHALAHTRMATESAVTTEHSHPFSTGRDLCLVHNGSLSNHNRLRSELERHGMIFQTDNDSEVAAGYLTHRMAEGASLEEALESSLEDLDGFFTFAIGTRDGFAVLRDGIACKPAVLAETDQWVAMASEYRSIAHLPGAAGARIWEPAPATVYAWSRN
ncbi:MAG: glutamine amidotransferase family protein [Chloroflexi bacterium]|nr:glutamine amidotransferase family protein [Chloroflexota bacterium]